jgi:molecular chaperone IbpA
MSNKWTDKWNIPFFDTFSFDDPFAASTFKDLKLTADSLTEWTKKITKSFPPYNIVKVDENKYVIEMALAGFGKDQIEITLDNGVLTVTGKKETASIPEQTYYVFKGIAERAFTRQFTLADKVEIKNAELVNGLLKIWLEALAGPEKTIKKIPINDNVEQPKSDPQLLVEEKDRMADEGGPVPESK